MPAGTTGQSAGLGHVRARPPTRRETCGPAGIRRACVCLDSGRPVCRSARCPGILAARQYACRNAVCHCYTFRNGAIEAGRRAAAYGLGEEELRREQPQIYDLLCTVFSAVPIGHALPERLTIGLPPRPPRIHAFVGLCSDEEICALTESPDFLRLLLAAPAESAPDELVAVCLRRACECRRNDFEYLVRAGKHLAALLRDNPDRLTALLNKLEP